MKQNLGFREFLLKGLDNVKIEMNLISIAHNLQKIYRMMREKTRAERKNISPLGIFRNFFAFSI